MSLKRYFIMFFLICFAVTCLCGVLAAFLPLGVGGVLTLLFEANAALGSLCASSQQYAQNPKLQQIAAILDKTHPMAPTTLLTVLSRLADKGFLRIEKTGRSAEYWPLVAREDYLARQGRKFYDTLCGGSLPAFAAALCASGLTAEELAELRELLREGTL